MHKKKPRARLQLDLTTIRHLEHAELRPVVGGDDPRATDNQRPMCSPHTP